MPEGPAVPVGSPSGVASWIGAGRRPGAAHVGRSVQFELKLRCRPPGLIHERRIKKQRRPVHERPRRRRPYRARWLRLGWFALRVSYRSKIAPEGLRLVIGPAQRLPQRHEKFLSEKIQQRDRQFPALLPRRSGRGFFLPRLPPCPFWCEASRSAPSHALSVGPGRLPRPAVPSPESPPAGSSQVARDSTRRVRAARAPVLGGIDIQKPRDQLVAVERGQQQRGRFARADHQFSRTVRHTGISCTRIRLAPQLESCSQSPAKEKARGFLPGPWLSQLP